ncbi:MAG TPA: hypothetical protein VNT75_06360 [Symbiobacteriaceae bacterium]|nr:hypothetical protein [Symbiobacteriaceae bacterium]
MRSQIIPRIKLYPMGLQYVSRRNPWMTVWWSVALPGFGHLLMGQNLRGLILMSWEILVNIQSNLNLAIYYSLVGQAEQAKAVVRHEWLILYPLFYIFSMYDAYRTCLDLNRLAAMERLQKHRRFELIGSSWLGTTHLSRRNPLMAALWSAALPGAGQLYAARGLKALTLMAWYLAVVLKSGLANATYHTILGDVAGADVQLDYEWLLFWPSVYLFGIADAYNESTEQNRIVDEAFRWRMRKYLRNGLK